MKAINIMAAVVTAAILVFTAGCGISGNELTEVAGNDGDTKPVAEYKTVPMSLVGGTGGNGQRGGPGAEVYIYPQNDGVISAEAYTDTPAIEIPSGATVIDSDVTWDNDMNGVHDNGLYIAAGVTVTVPAGLDDGGLNVWVDGPVIIKGDIVRGGDVARETVNVEIRATGGIVVSGTVDLTGPDGENGVSGGRVLIDNDLLHDSTEGIYILGDIITSGGNATVADGYGGDGGSIYIKGGDNEDITIAGSLVSNGGDGGASGSGGFGGQICIGNYSDNHPDATDDSTGNIYLYNMDRLEGTGGTGTVKGGDGGNFAVESDRGEIVIAAPFQFNGGDAPTAGGKGGDASQYAEIWINWETVDAAAPLGLSLQSTISMKGGYGDDGGNGGGLVVATPDGNFVMFDGIVLDGGDGIAGDGGDAGKLSIETWNEGPDPENFDQLISSIDARGGGGTKGGDGGKVWITNTTEGTICMNEQEISIGGGQGTVENGLDGTLTTQGNLQ